ncbi:helix-turn-helix transcriptional regulator [Streptomyces violens]|uniref:helix-turn-helix transcriptional regulator n=1 Tax=Streptomyces violens TaxID=66377 RepID=UPI00099890CF|nr:helix-turn-helix domain-containing protein [Streptomyces violens]
MDQQSQQWSFLSKHTRVLWAVASTPNVRLRDLAAVCNITERTAQHIVADLEQAGYLDRERVGRRSRYTVHPDQPLRHPAEAGLLVRDLLALRPAVEGGG